MSQLTDNELISELQKRFEQNKQTLQELCQMTNKLLTLNKKLEQSEAMKTHFISNITNDIINPFSSILGLTKHLMNMGKEDYEKMQEFARMIHEEAFDLDFQLKNIFAAAKLEEGEFTPQIARVRLVDLFQNTIEDFEQMTQKKNVTIQFDYSNNSTIRHEDAFKTDSGKLQMVMINLLHNAIRFSPENNEVNVQLTITNKDLQFTIRDYGQGIAPEETEKIFDRFYRLNESIHSENKGLGLGLAVTKGIIEMMGGRIQVKQPEKGAELTVWLPEDQSADRVEEVSSSGNEIFFDDDDNTPEKF